MHLPEQWQQLLLVVFLPLEQEAFLLLVQVEYPPVECNTRRWGVHQLSEDKILMLLSRSLDSHKLYKVEDTHNLALLKAVHSLNLNKLVFHRLTLVCHKTLVIIRRKVQLAIQTSDSPLLNKI